MSNFEKSQADKILSCYNNIEKSGEGSKGGKVVGHTSSGKPIYESYHTNNEQGRFSGDPKIQYNHQDHQEAAKKLHEAGHHEEAIKHENNDKGPGVTRHSYGEGYGRSKSWWEKK
jgi:hypothetical protein